MLRYGLRTKNERFRGFRSFRVRSIHKIENSEISESFLLPQSLALVLTQNLKTIKS